MATGTRIYANLEQGTTSGSHTDSVTTMTFTASAEPGFSLATGEYAVLSWGDFTDLSTVEIVHIVGPYTAGASTATMERGKEGTAAQAHGDAEEWRLVMVGSDLTSIVQGDNLLCEETLTADGTFTVNHIPAGYGDLLVVMNLRSDNAATQDTATLRVGNGTADTGSNYATQAQYITWSATVGSDEFADRFRFTCNAANADANVFSQARLVLSDYAGNLHKFGLGTYGAAQATNDSVSGVFQGRWKSTSVIDTITVVPTTGTNFKSGSSIRVYGMRRRDVAQTSFIGAKAHRTAAQSMSSTTWTGVAWTVENYDSHGFLDIGGSNPERLTIPAGQAGKYLVEGTLYINDGQRRVLVNGTDAKTLTGITATANDDYGSVHCVLDLAVGDYVELQGYNAGGSMGSNGEWFCNVSITKLGMAASQGVDAANGGKETLDTNATAGATPVIDLADGNVHDITLTANATFTFTGATDSKGCSFTLILRQDGTGGRTVTWPTSVDWNAGTAPTLSTAASSVSMLTFMTVDGGTTWFGALVGDAFA